MTNITTIEDCLELVAGFHLGPKIQIKSSDVTIMHSIARQVFKGTALTDRQFALMKEKLLAYKDQFENLDCDFDYAIEQLRQPLREIDRSKYIRICKERDEIPLSGIDENKQWIEVRFPFKKSLIMLINDCANTENYFHKKGSHNHFYALTDVNIDIIMSKFIDKGFEIDQYLLDRYEAIQQIKENKNKYIPFYDGENLLNVSSNLIECIEHEVGTISSKNFNLVVDRSLKYGFYVDKKTPIGLTENIAFRNNHQIQIKPSKTNIKELLTTLYELHRFPMLVVLDDGKCLDQLNVVFKTLQYIVPNTQQSVMFRKDGQDDFNVYVKDKALNNWVDKSTKVVYINSKKVPKVLLNCNWNPITVLTFNSFANKEIDAYTSYGVDLYIAYEENLSPFYAMRQIRNING